MGIGDAYNPLKWHLRAFTLAGKYIRSVSVNSPISIREIQYEYDLRLSQGNRRWVTLKFAADLTDIHPGCRKNLASYKYLKY